MTMAHHPHPPPEQSTRGKTARNRLRRVDNFVLLCAPDLVRRRDGDFVHAPFVDLGYGAEPWTTLESAARLRRLNPTLPVLGVEIDPERVAAAQPFADGLTQFRQGGFDLPLSSGADGRPQRARLIRAFNVLRQYDEAAVAGAHAAL
ncbi:MAG: methylase, partial [Anaerolineae bacterium]